MPELDHHPEDESHYDCEFCRDTGKLDGSDYYDCAHCSIAQERVKLEERMGNMKRSMPTNDATWSLVKSERKRVLAVQAAELALLKSNLLQKERELAEVQKDTWQPIETAPKDTVVWAFNGEQGVMHWSEGEGWALWVWNDELLSDADPSPDQPTNWMPLPAPPAASVAQANKEQGNG